MAFVTVETWTIEPDTTSGIVMPRWLSGRPASTTAALLLSLIVDVALVGALILAGQITAPVSGRANPSITAFDLPSPSDQQAGAAPATRPVRSPSAPSTDVEVTRAPPVKTEWSVTALPPLPAPPTVAAPPTAPSPIANAASGSAPTGAGVSSGYDPYAFASYRRPDRDGLSGPSQASLTPLPGALATVQARLRRTLATPGIRIMLRVAIDPDGRIALIDGADPLPPGAIIIVSRIVLGLAIFAADPARPSNTMTTIQLDL